MDTTKDLATREAEQQRIENTLYEKPKPASPEFYSPEVALRSVFETRAADLGNVLGLTTEQRATDAKQFTETIRQSGLDAHSFGQTLYHAVVDARLAEARGADDPDIQAASEQARAALASTYGREAAEDLLARTQKFVKQFPKLAAILATHGIGSRADIVIPIAEHVRRVNFR